MPTRPQLRLRRCLRQGHHACTLADGRYARLPVSIRTKILLRGESATTDTWIDSDRGKSLGRLLFRGYRAINVGLLEELRAAGHSQLRLGHVAVLSNLDLSEGTRLVTIAERAGVTKQAIGPVVREREALGYVNTASDPSDGRAKLASLTTAGRQVIEQAQPMIDRIEATVRRNLGSAGFETLVGLLDNLLDGFDEGDAYPER